jgi:putative peptidoglycan lipid II flippase
MTLSLRRAAALVLGLTLTVNALNYLRDAALAARFGASPASDALFSALLLPAILQQMLVAGTLAPAVVPVYLEVRRTSQARAWRLIWQALFGVAVALIPLAALAVWQTPALVNVLFPGFDPATQVMTMQALRFFLPGAVCLILAGLTGALLNAHEHFFVPALTPGLGSAAVLALLALQPTAAVPALALVVALAMGAQLILHLPALLVTARPGEPTAVRQAHRTGPELVEGLAEVRDPLPTDAPVGLSGRAPWQRVLSLSLPLFAYVSLSQITTLVERVFASHLGAGAVARLTLAQKLSSLPLFLVAGSLAVVIFPRLAALQVDRAAFRAALAAGLRSALPLLLISTVWLISGSQLLVALLYQHGRFSAQDSALTAGLLQGYALGLAPAGLGAILLKALHARQDVHSPLAVAAVSLACYLALAALCSRMWGAVGLALALSATAVISTSLLALVLVQRHEALAWRRLLTDLWALLPAALTALAVGWLAEAWLRPALGATLPALLLRMLALALAGGSAFLLLARRAGFVRGDLRAWLGRLRGRRSPPVSPSKV